MNDRPVKAPDSEGASFNSRLVYKGRKAIDPAIAARTAQSFVERRDSKVTPRDSAVDGTAKKFEDAR